MNKDQMLQELEERLKGLPADDRQKLIELYEDLIDVAKENRNVNSSFMEPVALEDNSEVPHLVEKKSYRNSGRMILALVSLILFNSIFVLGPAIAVISIYFSLWIMSFCFVVSPLLVVTQVFVGGFTSLEFFISILLCGIGILLGVGMIKAGKGLYKIFSMYVNWNLGLIKGE
ncbi:DUF1700 domain-containing protein [Bacillus sp. HNG]|uniref:HAAS domain-containing protein n=1 Tax=Bacillus sp. HNG TaxID=2293325 RepID=UPI000E2ED357|nr:DUF1700 domain-containing protein [Bacillus sp. HNG]RFB12064.1 DUF1700 domain-containing protein [Bacillus sp. HNG]